MDYQKIIVETSSEHIATITLNRPKHLNTFNTQLAQELSDALQTLDTDEHTHVIVIKGAGKGFCAGIDVSEYFDQSAMEYRHWIECMENPLVAISRLNKPVIAQVHGVAAANGAGLAAAADITIAADNARIGLTAINVGLNCIGPVVPVSRIIGRKRALELLLYGDLIDAQKALQMGLFNKVVAYDDLDQTVWDWAVRLAQKSPIAVQIAKKAFYTASDMDYHSAFEYMNEAFARLCTTHDAKEGITAFLEKRDPKWQKR